MKRFASLFGTMLLASLVFGAPFRVSAAESNPRIVLSEVNWAGSALSTVDEWIELANLDAAPADISGWSLTGAAGSSGSGITIPEGTVLAGYGTYLVSNYDLASEKTTLGVSPDLVTTAVSLANSKLNVALLDLSGAIVDTATTASSPTTGSTQPLASMQRDLSNMIWMSAAASTNLTDATQFGNPGSMGYAAPAVSETIVPDKATNAVAETNETIVEVVTAEETSTPINISEALPPANEEVSSADPILEIIETIIENAGDTIDATNETEQPQEPAADIVTSPVRSILINAFLSAPANGAAESITFYNTTTEAIDLTGWTVADATGKTTELSGIIEPSTEVTLENPKGKLNNDGDTIVLMDPSGAVVDQVTYGTDELPEPGSGETLTRTGDTWTIIEAIAENVESESSIEAPVTENLVEVTKSPTEEMSIAQSSAEAEATSSEETVSSSAEADTLVETVSEPATVETTTALEEEEATSSAAEEDFSLNLPEQGSALNPFSSGDVLITEFVSDPADGVEWIEFYNTTGAAIDLTGWTITDAAGKATELSGSLEPSMYATVQNPKGKLNNDGDSIFLYDASGALIDEVTYGTETIPKPKKGQSVARAGDIWAISETPTPGAINFISDSTTYAQSSSTPAEDSTTNTSSSGTDAVGAANHSDESQTVSSAHEIHTGSVASLSSASDVPAASSVATSVNKKAASSTKKTAVASSSVTTVSYTGVVTALPGTFGTQIAFMEGIELYFNNADWPLLQLGDVIQVRGVPSTAQGESRIKIANASAITVLRHQEEQPRVTDLSALSQAKEGSLVRVQGTIATRDGKTLTLENENASIQVIAYEKTDIRWSAYTGGTLQIVGVVRFLNGTAYLYPRSTADITIVTDALTESAAATSAAAGDDTSGPSGSFLPLALALLATGALSGLTLWMLRRRQSSALALELAANPS